MKSLMQFTRFLFLISLMVVCIPGVSRTVHAQGADAAPGFEEWPAITRHVKEHLPRAKVVQAMPIRNEATSRVEWYLLRIDGCSFKVPHPILLPEQFDNVMHLAIKKLPRLRALAEPAGGDPTPAPAHR